MQSDEGMGVILKTVAHVEKTVLKGNRKEIKIKVMLCLKSQFIMKKK